MDAFNALCVNKLKISHEVHQNLSIYSPALREWVVSYVHKLAIAFRIVFIFTFEIDIYG